MGKIIKPGVVHDAIPNAPRPMALQLPDFNQTVYVYTGGPMEDETHHDEKRSNWRERLPNLSPALIYLHPRVDGGRFGVYFPSDLVYLDKSDMMVVYLNAGDAPRTGTAFEMGRAHRDSKPIIMVDERAGDHRYDLIRTACDVIVPDFKQLEQVLLLFLGEKEAVVFAGENNEG